MYLNPSYLRLLRQTRRWTQEELAIAAGVSLRTIQRAEQDGNVGLATVKSLAAALEVDAHELESVTQETRTPSLWGLRLGTLCGMGGAILGWLMATFQNTRAVMAGEITAAEHGMTVGLLSAFAGAVCAAIGWYYRREKARIESPRL